jgi:lysophospholipase L1-like esterase
LRQLIRRAAPIVIAAVAIAGLTAAPASATPQQNYYLSLGDSLSVGFEPDGTGVGHPTSHGFDNDLKASDHGLTLAELGCPNETTTSMINGGVCGYAGVSSQLAAATRFLAAHAGHVRLVTVDIGATDVENCVQGTAIDPTCVQQGLAAIQTNLATIVTTLREADPYDATRFIGLTEYDPFLASYLQGPAGQQTAAQSIALAGQLNQIITAGYTSAGYRVADVSGAYRTTDSTDMVPLPGFGQVPVNVATICQLTFMCAAAPVGPNIHPNDNGYAVIANAVAAQL